MEIRTAQRKRAKIKLALQGPTGSGKTMSALLLASPNYPFASRGKLAVVFNDICTTTKTANLKTKNVSRQFFFH